MDVIVVTTGQNGYSADQVAEYAINVTDLIEQITQLAEEFGGDTRVVICGSGRGAVWEPVRGLEGQYAEDAD
jgi:hypothetical protein